MKKDLRVSVDKGHYTSARHFRMCKCGADIELTVIKHTTREEVNDISGCCNTCQRRWGYGDQDIEDKQWALQLKTHRPFGWKEDAYIVGILGKDHKGIHIEQACDTGDVMGCGDCYWKDECRFSSPKSSDQATHI